jgi:T-complex protein 1 subunit gamma
MLTELRAHHNHPEKKNIMMGIDGNQAKIANMEEVNVWDPVAVKIQTYKTAIESACMLLRIDDIVSGIQKDHGKA